LDALITRLDALLEDLELAEAEHATSSARSPGSTTGAL
jgi:hypothetical protein